MHPLKIVALIAWLSLLASQLWLLLLLESPLWSAAATIPLLIPVIGLIRDQLYTYKWFGFVTLIYFCIGVSELVANPPLRLYAVITLIGSVVLLFSSIYYVRYLARR